MKESTSGSSLPTATYTWLIANQAIAAGANFSPPAIAVPGARLGNGQVIVNARAALPATAAGSVPSIEARISADDAVIILFSNASAAALVATAANIILDIMILPIRP